MTRPLLRGSCSLQSGLRPELCFKNRLRRFCSASAPLPSELGDRHKNSTLQINNICSTASAPQHSIYSNSLYSKASAHYSRAFGPPFARTNWPYRLYSCLYIEIRLRWFCSASAPLPSELGDRHKNSSLQINNICSTASALQHLLQQPLLQGLAHYSRAFGPPFAGL